MNEDRTEVLGRRIGAALIDLVLLTILFVVLGLLIGDTESGDGNASVNLDGAGGLLFFALTLLYYGITEAMTGQTLGKRLLGVRVVNAADGSKPSGGAIAGRTVLRAIDGLPFAYLLGLVVVLATGTRRQRIGDLAAGTKVVAA